MMGFLWFTLKCKYLPFEYRSHSWSLCSHLKAKQKTELGLRVDLYRKVLSDPSACTFGFWFIISNCRKTCVQTRARDGDDTRKAPSCWPAPWKQYTPALWVLANHLPDESQLSIPSCYRQSGSCGSCGAWEETWLVCLLLLKRGSAFLSATSIFNLSRTWAS